MGAQQTRGAVSQMPTHSGDGWEFGGDIIVTFGDFSINLGSRPPAGLAPQIAAAPEMLEALRPFAKAAEVFAAIYRNAGVSGETEAERRFSDGEAADRAREVAAEYLARLPEAAYFAAEAALAKAVTP